ncbi:MAG: DUF3196 family protein [Mycoplasmatales bacterium]|nr:DUF3196 family protein [Mycoplasmatales bacterium]
MSNKNYYEEKIDEIKELLSDSNFKKIYQLINEELKMPYIPEKYEKYFLDTINQIKHHVVGDDSHVSVSRHVAMEYLLSEDFNQESIALELLRDHNLRYEKELLKNRIETWPAEKNILKAFLFELLVEQEISIDINFNGILMNPAKNGSILENKEVKKTLQAMEKYFEKNPSTLNMALDEFQRFLLITYPAVPEDGDAFAFDISQIIKSMFDEKIGLTERQNKIKEILKQ